MRKGIAFALVLLLLIFAMIYLIIPNTISISERAGLSVNEKGFARVFFNEQNWPQWWPGEKERVQDANTAFVYNDKKYTITAKRFTSLLIAVSHEQDSVQTELFLIPVRTGRAELAWVCTMSTSLNPIIRIQRFFQAKNLSADFHSILQRLQTYYNNDDKLYGFEIRETRVVDSLLVSTFIATKNKPTTDDVYRLVDKLKAFVANKGAAATSEPMLNVSPAIADSGYLTRVAIPINTHLKSEGDVAFKQMLGNGNILTTTVNGGPAQVEQAFAQMGNFVIENNRTAPAIPFQKLITDRRAEPDTTKWVTKIYWPVM